MFEFSTSKLVYYFFIFQREMICDTQNFHQILILVVTKHDIVFKAIWNLLLFFFGCYETVDLFKDFSKNFNNSFFLFWPNIKA